MQVARLAMEQGRTVYVVPANVGSPTSAGTNDLLRKNLAVPILRGSHVLEDFYAQFPDRLHPASLPKRRPPAPKADPAPRPKPVRPKASEKTAAAEKKVDSTPHSVYIDFRTRKNDFTDDEIAHSKVPVDRAISTITLLTLRGYVDNPTSSYFTLTDQVKELLEE